jgi:hypothetical protein
VVSYDMVSEAVSDDRPGSFPVQELLVRRRDEGLRRTLFTLIRNSDIAVFALIIPRLYQLPRCLNWVVASVLR